MGASVMTTFMWLTGGMDIHFFLGTRNPRIGLALLLLYWFVMSMVLLNCLVAIMADACNRVRLCLVVLCCIWLLQQISTACLCPSYTALL